MEPFEPTEDDFNPLGGELDKDPAPHVEVGPPLPPPRAELPEGNFLWRALSDLNRMIVAAGPLLRAAWLPAALSLLALLPLAAIAFSGQLCCALTLLLGGWSFCSALLHVGPYTAFGRAALGEEVRTRPTLRLARSRFMVTFLAFAPHSLVVVGFYVALFFALITTVSVRSANPSYVFFIPALLGVAAITIFCLWVSLRWLYLAPLVAVVEGPLGVRAAFRRAGELSKGRVPFLLVARFVPDLITLATIPQLNGMAQFDRSLAFMETMSVLGPILGLVGTTYVGALLAAAAYVVVTGSQARLEQEPRD